MEQVEKNCAKNIVPYVLYNCGLSEYNLPDLWDANDFNNLEDS
jgi:hypothetical protein